MKHIERFEKASAALNSGGVVHRRPLDAVVGHRLVRARMADRRLRYPGSPKARKARKRILRHWMVDALDQAEEEARG